MPSLSTYLAVAFFLGLASLTVRSILLAFADYPRTTTTARWTDVLGLIIQAFFTLWVFALRGAS